MKKFTSRLAAVLLFGALVSGLVPTPSFAASALVIPIYRTPASPTPYVDAVVTAATTAEDYTVQTFSDAVVTGKPIIIVFAVRGISGAESSFCIRCKTGSCTGGAAAIPGADVADGSSCTVNPAYLTVAQGDVLSIITPGAAQISLRYYRAF